MRRRFPTLPRLQFHSTAGCNCRQPISRIDHSAPRKSYSGITFSPTAYGSYEKSLDVFALRKKAKEEKDEGPERVVDPKVVSAEPLEKVVDLTVQMRKELQPEKDWSWNSSVRLRLPYYTLMKRKGLSLYRGSLDEFVETEWEESVEDCIQQLRGRIPALIVILARKERHRQLRKLVKTLLEGADENGWEPDEGILGTGRPTKRDLRSVRFSAITSELVYSPEWQVSSEELLEQKTRFGYIMAAIGTLLLSNERVCWIVAKQIMAYLHSMNVLPDTLYDPTRHPRISASQSRVLTILADAVWKVKNDVEKASAPSAIHPFWDFFERIGQFWGSSDMKIESPGEREILLEILLWACIDGMHFVPAHDVVRKIYSADGWQFAHFASDSVEFQAEQLLERGMPASMGVTGYELTPPPIEIRKRCVPKAIETALCDQSLTSGDPEAVRELLSTLAQKDVLDEDSLRVLKNLCSSPMVRSDVELSINLLPLLERSSYGMRNHHERRSEILLRYAVISRLISFNAEQTSIQKHWEDLQARVDSFSLLENRRTPYLHPQWFLGSVFEYFSTRNIHIARSLLIGNNPQIAPEDYIDLLPYMIDYIAATGDYSIPDQIERTLAEQYKGRSQKLPVDTLSDLLIAWLRLGYVPRAISILNLMHNRQLALDDEATAAFVTAAFQMASRQGKRIEDFKLYFPYTEGPLPLNHSTLQSFEFPNNMWINLLHLAFKANDMELAQIASERLDMNTQKWSYNKFKGDVAEAVVRITTEKEGTLAGWRTFNHHFNLFSENQDPEKSTPHAGLVMFIYEAASREAYNKSDKATTEEAKLELLVLKDIQKWAGMFLKNKAKWSFEDFGRFHHRLFGTKFRSSSRIVGGDDVREVEDARIREASTSI